MFNYNPRAYPEWLKGDVDTSIQTIFTSETSIEEEKYAYFLIMIFKF